ncbi:MAG: LytTR family DNA-binding domain-containing protein [Faecalibacterium prausnitzii]
MDRVRHRRLVTARGDAGAQRRLHQRSQLLATPGLERYQLAFLDVDLKTTRRHCAGAQIAADRPRHRAGVHFGLSGICPAGLHGQRLPLPTQAGYCRPAAQLSGGYVSGMSDPRKTLEVHHNRTTSEIPLDQIYYLESDLRQINVYGDIPHQPICTFYGKIADLPAMLYENGFLQVGRSDVVNLQYVRSIRNYKVELRSGVELSVSRQYYTAIRSAWLEWKGQFGDE